MQSVTVFLAFTCFCLEVHHVYCNFCSGDKYTIVFSNGSSADCLTCATCHPGRGLYPRCGTKLTHEKVSDISCKKCPSGTFSAELDSSSCKNCQQCAPHEIVSANCTKVSDTSCNKTCAKGYFFAEVSHSCQQCSYCCFDKKDEPQPECIKHGFNATGQYCSIRLDKTCAPVPPTTRTTLPAIVTDMTATSRIVPHDTTKGSSQNTITIVFGVLAFIFAFAVLIVGFLCWRIRRKATQSMRGVNDNITCEALYDANYASQGPIQGPTQGPIQGSTQGPTQSHSSAEVQLPLAFPKVTELQTNSGYATSSPEGSPYPTDDELVDQLSELKDGSRKKRNLKRTNSKEAQASKDSASESLLGSKEEDSDENEGQDKYDVDVTVPRRPSLVERAKRKLSKDHYKPLQGEDSDEQDGNAQEGERRSSGPIISFKALKRKLSSTGTPNKENLQDPNEDDDTETKPFKVMVQPRYQEQKEGSRVEFECNISGEREARYQWFKDDSKIQGQRNSSLVLDPVKVEDFGNYKCEVKYDDGDSEKCVTSLPSELDVIPCDGMELKCLRDVDLNIQEKVGNLLTKKKPGTPTWIQLANRYTMEDHHIDSLEHSHETAGRELIEFLAKSYPKLTVYEICKELKEKDIRRLDIVEVLSAHLSAPMSGGDVP
nr:uncharacterized protein LOC131776470 isoform X2 [Pocillopora verrucosa]